MPRTTPHETTLSKSLQASGGLKQFRTVAERSKDVGDGPFGPPAEKRTRKERRAKTVVEEQKVVDVVPEVLAPHTQEPPQTVRETTPPSASLYTENVTLPLSESLRDRSEELARTLNRCRSVRKKRLTRNSVIRVALQRFLEDFSLAPGESINSEEELLDAARAMRRSQ